MTEPQTRSKNTALFVPGGRSGVQRRKRPTGRDRGIVVPGIGSQGHFESPPGIAILRRKKLTTGRMTRILRAIGITVSQHGVWVGWPLSKYIDANPSWTEFQWYQLVCENRALILNPPDWPDDAKGGD